MPTAVRGEASIGAQALLSAKQSLLGSRVDRRARAASRPAHVKIPKARALLSIANMAAARLTPGSLQKHPLGVVG